MGQAATASDVAEAAAEYHNWTDTPVFSAEDNVRTVITTYDYARKELLNDFLKYLKDDPTSFNDAIQRSLVSV